MARNANTNAKSLFCDDSYMKSFFLHLGDIPLICGLETDMIKVLCNNNNFQSLNVSHLKSRLDMTFRYIFQMWFLTISCMAHILFGTIQTCEYLRQMYLDLRFMPVFLF